MAKHCRGHVSDETREVCLWWWGGGGSGERLSHLYDMCNKITKSDNIPKYNSTKKTRYVGTAGSGKTKGLAEQKAINAVV